MLFTRTDSRRTIWGEILILSMLVLPLSSITARADEPVGGAPPPPAPAPAPTTPAPAPPAPAPAPEATPAPAAATPAPPPTTPAPEATSAPAPAPSKDLKTSVRDFWHYGKVARYDLANTEGQMSTTNAEWLVAEWTTHFADVMQTMADAKPTIS